MKLKLQSEIHQANSKQPPRDMKRLFKKACSTDLLFLIDTTCSMEPYLESAKNQVKDIVLEIKRAFFGESEVRVAVVSYKDHQSPVNIEFLDFTTSTNRVFLFLDGLGPANGFDFPEDVLGGIHQALRALWNQQTRCMIHIGDAPPHGRGSHDFDASCDNYHVPGSEPHGLTYRPLLSKLVDLKINYALLRIAAYTDRMALNFARAYGQRNAKLHALNIYYNEFKQGGSGGSSKNDSRAIAIEPQFEEFQLGIEYSNLQHLVVRTVTNSVSRTANRLSMTLSASTKPEEAAFSQNLEMIFEEDSVNSRVSNSNLESVSLEKIQPQWTTAGWFDNSLEMRGFCPAIIVHDSETLTRMMAADENIKLDVVELTVQARSKPFAHGAVRKAFYARTEGSDSRFVLKSFLKGTNENRAQVVEDMRIQTLCKAFALDFNGLLDITPPLDFIVTSCLQRRLKSASECMSLEQFVEGEYVKYNNNASWVNEDLSNDSFSQVAQAFSHFTFERSWGLFLINDLQGVNHLLTDPAVQTRDPERFKLHDTNLNEAGFKFFFIRHECNTFCHRLGLKSNREMFALGRELEFRKEWPTMAPTVCCSNKFCRDIIRMANSHESADFAGHHWCSRCWEQLNVPTIRQLCTEDRPKHGFEVSRFFYESQGQCLPSKCPDHREKDMAESSAAAAGGSMWNRLKSTDSKGSLLGNKW
jgi:hypothetical protein